MIRISKLFLLLLAGSIALLLLLGGTFAYYMLCFLVSLLVVMSVYMLLVKQFLSVEIEQERSNFRVGEENEVVTRVNCLLPIPYITISRESELFPQESGSVEISSITLAENRWLTNRLIFKRRGCYALGRVSLEAVDLFRLLRLKSVIESNRVLKVYPRVYEIESLGMMGRDIFQEVINKNSNNVNSYTIRDLRKYRDGDSLKRIHWKASAKQNSLLVKNFDNIAGRGFTLFVDMNRRNMELDEEGVIEELTIDYLCSLLNFLVKNSVTVKLFLNTAKGYCTEISRIEDFYNFLELITEQESDGELSFIEFIHKHIHMVDTMNMLGIISPVVDEQLKMNLLGLKDSGYSSTLFYTVDDRFCKEQAEMLSHSGIPAFHSDELLN